MDADQRADDDEGNRHRDQQRVLDKHRRTHRSRPEPLQQQRRCRQGDDQASMISARRRTDHFECASM
jgi:hypothetical protein